MFSENISIGLDVATSLSIITAAVVFLWNAINSKKKDREELRIENEKKRNEIRKNTIRKQVIVLIEKLYLEKSKLTELVEMIGEGETQDLNAYINIIKNFAEVVEERFMPFATVYGDERFLSLYNEYADELYKFIHRLNELTRGDSSEKWDFYSIMYEPKYITNKFIQNLLVQSEAYIESLN